MKLRHCAPLLCALLVCAQTAQSARQDSVPTPPLVPSAVVGARVENVILDRVARTATIRIRNLSTSDITGFALAIEAKVGRAAPQASGRINDLLPGIQAGQLQAIHPGASYDDVVNTGNADDVTAALTAVTYSDASAEFSDRETFIQIIAERRAAADAAKQTEEVIRGSSSKAQAVAKLTELWEWAKDDNALTAPLLQSHLYNLQHQPVGSEADQKMHMIEYAAQADKQSKFFSIHANLHGRVQ